jgi:hypothetical protein
MSSYRKIFYILMIITFIMGCASSGKEQKKAEVPPSGTIHLEEWQFMAILSGDFGHGTLAYNDKIYKFKMKGMGALGYGVQKLSGVGHVYHLNNIADFPGSYSEARAGLTVAKGVGALYIRNDNDIVIELKTHAEGVALSVGVSGITIEME